MIYIAKYENKVKGEHGIEITDKTISKEEFDAFFKNFKCYGKLHQFKEIHDICLEENHDLSMFLSYKNLNDLLRKKQNNTDAILRTANKLLLNYCTVIKILIDKISKDLNKKQKEEFDKFCSSCYDNHFSYRFFMRMRNFIIHNNMPFTIVVRSIKEDCKICMSKKDILKWDKWNTVKTDIESFQEERIEIQSLLKDIGSTMYAVYLNGIYYLAPDVLTACENVGEFLKKYEVKDFCFIEYDTKGDFEKGKFQLYPIPINTLLECVDELNKHPSININFVEH